MSTLSLNIKTFIPFISALFASAAAYSPATDIIARFASGIAFFAPAMLLNEFCILPEFLSLTSFANSSFALLHASSSFALTAIIRSFGPAVFISSVSSPKSQMVSLLSGVPIPIDALSTPSVCASLPAIFIRNTES